MLYYETYSDIEQAIEREKKVKKLSRVNKDKLIDKMNKERKDLYEEILSAPEEPRYDNNDNSVK